MTIYLVGKYVYAVKNALFVILAYNNLYYYVLLQ